MPALHGSADALVLARAAQDLKSRQQMLVAIVANASDARRLLEEIPWFSDETEEPLRCHLLPDWETLPYDSFSPHQDLVSQRLATLYEVSNGRCDVLLVPASTALLRIAPPAFLAAHTFYFKQGETLDEEKLKSQLTIAGYNHVSQVMSPGEYSVRGGLIDLFPMGSKLPYRLDLFGDTIETIRTFDPDNQRSLYPVREIRMLPGHEFPMDENSRAFFRSRWREVFEGDPTLSVIYRDIASGIASAGIEYYLPLFFEETTTLFRYLPENAVFAMIGNVNEAFQRFWADTQSRYNFLKSDRERPLLAPEKLFLTSEDFFVLAQPFARWVIQTDDAPSELSAPIPDVSVNRRADDPLANLRAYIKRADKRVMICAESPGRRETMQQFFNEYDFKVTPCTGFADFATSKEQVMFGISPVQKGFALGYVFGDLAFITETELYANSGRRAGRKRTEAVAHIESIVRDLSELKIGDPVVHANHGIGRYRGLVTVDLGEGETEFLHLQYAKDTKLYVPVSQLHVISRYAGTSADDAPLHTLGSGQWEKAKQKAAQQIHDTAAELLDLYARRSMRKGFPFPLTKNDYEAFADSFGFEETPDQAAAIASVMEDMTSDKPMDRLICGDVGFGKTEVALRAAFRAASEGRQVALLCPTTVLAEQHYQTFRARLAGFPVTVGLLSRFVPRARQKEVLKAAAEGQIDILLGTHRLLSSDVSLPNLSLLILDEEQRFGVRHKEKLKALKKNVDVLTLTATPIPRTLQLSMSGIRDLSVIETAPQDRKPVATAVLRRDDATLRTVLERELAREGQVFWVYNRVQGLERVAEYVRKLVPTARVGMAHGQMSESELESNMHKFWHGELDVLVCTAIVESGLDFPRANALVVDQAQLFGLGQLYQLRGRVGRSDRQAYAFFVVPDTEHLSEVAEERLRIIMDMDYLGAGFQVAMEDLRLRGAGNILGEVQSGHMGRVGLDL